MRKYIFMFVFLSIISTAIVCNNSSHLNDSTEPPTVYALMDQTKVTTEDHTTAITEDDEISSIDETEKAVTDMSDVKDTESITTDKKESIATSATETTQETERATETESITTEPETSITSDFDTETTIKSEWIPKVYASAGNAEEISTLVVKYINDYRAEQGVVSVTQLPGLTEYAEHRSVQLVSNYAHDTDDERAAATALKYGRYIDPSLYGISGEPYYTSEAREALAFTGKVGTVDEVAKHIATMIRNSSGHWAYVGSGEYVYVGVGITYESGYWYCDIAMSRVNNG